MEDIPMREDSTESGGLEEPGDGGESARATPGSAESGALEDERTDAADDPA